MGFGDRTRVGDRDYGQDLGTGQWLCTAFGDRGCGQIWGQDRSKGQGVCPGSGDRNREWDLGMGQDLGIEAMGRIWGEGLGTGQDLGTGTVPGIWGQEL